MDISGQKHFTEQLEAAWEKLVLVDFWAERCGPCRTLKPELVKLAEKYSDHVVLFKINVDDDANEPLSREYGVRSIPQVTLFMKKDKIDQFVWALPPAQIEELIKSHITA